MRRSIRVLCTMALALVLQGPGSVSAARIALLIGVGDYQSRGIDDLEGPVNDVTALRRVLIDHWGFRAGDVHTLVDAQATRAAIMRELRRLWRRSAPGDQVFVYFSGHGTSVHDPKLQLKLPDNSGAQAPWDLPFGTDKQAIIDGLIIGRRDLRPLFHRLDQGGRQVFAVFDSCYSGNGVRGIGGGDELPSRNLETALPADLSAQVLAASDAAFAKTSACFDCGIVRPDEPYPYKNLVFLAAADDWEEARDIDRDRLSDYPTIDGQPHGAFTDALLRVLSGQLPADRDHRNGIEYGELHTTLRDYLEKRGIPHTPQLLPWLTQDVQGLASRPLFAEYKQPPAATDYPPPKSPPAPTGKPFRISLDVALPSRVRRTVLGLSGIIESARQPDLRIEVKGPSVRLRSPSGDAIIELPASDLDAIADAVRRQRWIGGLLAAGRGDAGFNLSIELSAGTRGSTLVIGDHIRFALKSERAVHLILLDLMPDGSVVVLYPRDPGELAPLPANRVARIPDNSRPIKVVPPPGTDQVLALGLVDDHPIIGELMRGPLFLDRRQQARIEQLLHDPSVRVATARLPLHTVDPR